MTDERTMPSIRHHCEMLNPGEWALPDDAADDDAAREGEGG